MGCSVLNCASRHPQYRMFRFPANLDRMKVWAALCGRNDWVPTKNAQICEVSVLIVYKFSKIIKRICSIASFFKQLF